MHGCSSFKCIFNFQCLKLDEYNYPSSQSDCVNEPKCRKANNNKASKEDDGEPVDFILINSIVDRRNIGNRCIRDPDLKREYSMVIKCYNFIPDPEEF